MASQTEQDRLLHLTAGIVSAHVSHNSVEPHELPSLIATVHKTLAGVGTPTVEPVKAEPAVAIKKSVFVGHLVCIDCGKSFKILKRHLSADHGMSPTAYRQKWGLPASYPMVAANYAAMRSKLAKRIGLGRIRAEPAAAPAAKVTITKIPERTRGRGRPAKSG